jgi:hypothetical protein
MPSRPPTSFDNEFLSASARRTTAAIEKGMEGGTISKGLTPHQLMLIRWSGVENLMYRPRFFKIPSIFVKISANRGIPDIYPFFII